MKETLLTVFGFASILNLNAQAPTYDWAAATGGTGSDWAYSVDADNAGNTYTTGYFYGTADFDPGAGTTNLTASSGSPDIFIQKLDASGNLVWAKSIGGAANEEAFSIHIDNTGDIYVAGYFQQTVDFDPGAGLFEITAIGGNDIFVLKLNASGDFIWAKQMGGGSDERAIGITTDLSGNVYTTGQFTNSADFDPGAGNTILTAIGGIDAYVQKLNSNGDFIWAKQIGGTSNIKGYSITTDSNGDIYSTGEFYGTADFDPNAGTNNLSSAAYSDSYIQKLDSNGNLLWASRSGGNNYAVGEHITIDASDNVLTTGYFYGIGDFDPGAGTHHLTAVGQGDVFIQKLDPSGNFIWAKGFGGTSNDRGKSVVTDASENVYVVGSFFGTVDFDPGVNTNNIAALGNTDAFIGKFDSNGEYIWVGAISGAINNEYAEDIVVDVNNNICTAGFFSQTVDFDPSAGSDIITWNGGTFDFYVHKMTQCLPATGTDVIVSCGDYSWVDGNIYTSDTSTATYVIAGGASSGCDSIVTLNLTINSVDTMVSINGITLTANTSGASYQWIDCDNNNDPINGATLQAFAPTINGNYACVIDDGTCQDTSSCYTISTVGIDKLNANSMNVYPNPGSDIITISSRFNIDRILIFDMMGSLVQTEFEMQFSIAKLTHGTYTISIQTAQGTIQKRFVKM